MDSLDQLRYVFNKDKGVSISKARDGVAKVIEKNKAEIWGVMSEGLKQSLFPNSNIQLLNSDSLTPTVINNMVNQFVEVF